MTLASQDKQLLRGEVVDWQTLDTLLGWFPVTIDASDKSAEPQVWWRWMGSRSLTAAFFQDSLAAQPAAERRVCSTPLSALQGMGDEFENSVLPTAFVFHVSRCGSTLLTQMLVELPHCLALSEPPVLDAFFRLHHSQPERSGGEKTFRQLLAALGQRRTGQEQHLVLKFDSWHTPWMPFVRSVFPATPLMFLYRQPDEVLASHRRQRGQHMVPGLLDTSLLLPDFAGLALADLDAYAQRVLLAVYRAALESAKCSQATLVNYRQLPDAVWTQLLPLWGIKPDAEHEAKLKARAGFHSKHAGLKFDGDPAAAPSSGWPAQHQNLLSDLYAELENLAEKKPGS